MSDTLSFVALAGQHAELLPARTVMSLFSTTGGAGGSPGTPGAGGAGIPGDGHTETSGTVDHVDTTSYGVPGADGSANPGS